MLGSFEALFQPWSRLVFIADHRQSLDCLYRRRPSLPGYQCFFFYIYG